jgi:hypothetical protein
MQAPQNFRDVVTLFIGLLNLLLPVLVGIAILAFVWGIIMFIRDSGDAKSHGDGRKFLIWSVIALTVLVSFMAIIKLFSDDFGFTYPTTGIPQLPTGT